MWSVMVRPKPGAWSTAARSASPTGLVVRVTGKSMLWAAVIEVTAMLPKVAERRPGHEWHGVTPCHAEWHCVAPCHSGNGAAWHRAIRGMALRHTVEPGVRRAPPRGRLRP